MDLTAAFDKLPRQLIWKVIELRTGTKNFVAILQAFYRNTRGNISNSEIRFDVFGGVRQGAVESPPALVWYFDWVLKILKHRVEKEVGSTGVSFLYKNDQFFIPKRGENAKSADNPKAENYKKRKQLRRFYLRMT